MYSEARDPSIISSDFGVTFSANNSFAGVLFGLLNISALFLSTAVGSLADGG